MEAGLTTAQRLRVHATAGLPVSIPAAEVREIAEALDDALALLEAKAELDALVAEAERAKVAALRERRAARVWWLLSLAQVAFAVFMIVVYG